MKRILIVAAAVMLVGCATGYKDFYRPLPNATPDMIAKSRSAPPPAEPAVDHTGLTGKALGDAYGAQGYAVIGYSSFNSGHKESDSNAVQQGKKVGADLVVISNPQYTGTQSSVIPIVTPTSSTSYTSGSATAYGSGGTATAYGSATTTTYGSQTNFIPISTNRYDYLAVYLVKSKVTLGLRTVDLTSEQRQELQSNHGVMVTVVITGSPAYDADILVGDFVLAMDGTPVAGAAGYSDLIRQKAGKLVSVTIYRHGQTFAKDIQLH